MLTMESKQQKLRLILKLIPGSLLEAPRNVSQEVYRRKLGADIARTKLFIEQAENAIEDLTRRHGKCPEVYDENFRLFSDSPEPLGKNWAPETLRQVHLLAHYEVYKQMPYQPMRNDLIGIATGLTLTLKAVLQQTDASEFFEMQNEARNKSIDELKSVLADYKEASALLQERIKHHSRRMDELQRKIELSDTYEAEIDSQLVHVQRVSDQAKLHEEKLQQHLVRVVLKLYAMMDWENANLMDEDLFKKSIAASASFLKTLVSNLGDGLQEKWVPIPPGSSEERLVEVMLRNDLLKIRDNGGREIRLRDYGLL